MESKKNMILVIVIGSFGVMLVLSIVQQFISWGIFKYLLNIVAFVFVISGILEIIILIPNIIEYVLNLDSVFKVAIVTGVVSIAGVVYSAYMKRKEYLSEKRKDAYLLFLRFMYELMIINPDMDKKRIIKNINKFQSSILLWGSPSVIRAWNTFKQNNTDNPQDTEKTLHYIEILINAMRTDLGVNKVKENEIIKTITKLK
ncbi:hypothetical protein NQ540_08575 [Granulicatella adiacens ATCC 49175]|uniref:Uncharacterized protein n=2 Tax=Granulicatella adiacens TaxID=46124 RepID=C8NIE9_9LACT|nr:hypothetical protein [Granulicatella adiacens]EEW36575.1 hypothetical protein HMPREF0444_1694 [Granulicatella adiacens ATCC 49175]UWP37946.1 hypothetical protein NQ540_08575 [Granulicatella adiacens ATCC 49175]